MAKKIQEGPLRYNRLKIVLAEKNMSQKAISEMSDISPNSISKWCNNTHQPSIQIAFKLAKILEVEFSDLFHTVNEVEKMGSGK
jgi:putative transcriptional regulator